MRILKHLLDSGDVIEIFLEGRELVMKITPNTGDHIVTLLTHEELCELIDSLETVEEEMSIDDFIDQDESEFNESDYNKLLKKYSGKPDDIQGSFKNDNPDDLSAYGDLDWLDL